ncbi:hypothetical protein GIB67_004727 [Kingdonia uniflora]|uniref:Uncharacterized protein n=1 Tax=Kingdonia uniflora TaxID=39325 RepID=A0A7J7P5D7_9MAGN|nr:hypothetical protein GIB67_004727 [Kingdonia uniflora]
MSILVPKVWDSLELCFVFMFSPIEYICFAFLFSPIEYICLNMSRRVLNLITLHYSMFSFKGIPYWIDPKVLKSCMGS